MRTMAANWIAGTVELSSKVRYGLTSRGVPLFRFVPYDKRLTPFAVGCSARDLFYNIHAIAEPVAEQAPASKNPLLRRAALVQTLGAPSLETELALLTATYAHDSRKELRKFPAAAAAAPAAPPDLSRHRLYPHPTFHIDPPGCRDVDDTFSFVDLPDGKWEVGIHIADVATAVQPGSPLDRHAAALSTSFYTPEGRVVQPMFPPCISEVSSSLLPSSPPAPKPTLSLFFNFDGQTITTPRWERTLTTTTSSYTYDEATRAGLAPLGQLAAVLGAPADADSHVWVERMMIFYNEQAGVLLAAHGTGILRRHAAQKLRALLAIPGVPPHLLYEAAEYCLSTDENTRHHGLGLDTYAYATSPLRRYADLINQRAIHAILDGVPVHEPEPEPLISDLNRRARQAKAFTRDLFFISLFQGSSLVTDGTVTIPPFQDAKGLWKTKVWVPDWKRVITARSLEKPEFEPGTSVHLSWYDRRDAPGWKERIVFKLSKKMS
jgi:exoribonuclease R